MFKNISNTRSALRRVCVWGLGGSGQAIVAKLLRMTKGLKTVSARVYDTNILSEDLEILKSVFVEANKERAELIRENPKDYAKFANFFRLERIPSLQKAEGTGQFISQGELLCAATIPDLISQINSSVKPLLNGSLPNQIKSSDGDLADNKLYFVIVRSMAGGTGSGTGVLFPSLVRRELLKLMGSQGRFVIIDIVLKPEFFESVVADKYKVYANAAAFLHMMSEYSRTDKDPVKVDFGDDPDSELMIGGGPAADMTYLIGNTNLSGVQGTSILSLDDIYEICAKYITLLANSSVMSRYFANYADIQHESTKSIANQPAIISSFGYCEKMFSGTKAQNWLVANAANRIISQMKGGE